MTISKKCSLVGLAILISISLRAQKRQYTIAEAVNGIATTLAPKSIKNPSWRPGTHEFFQQINGQYISYSPDNGKWDTVFTLAKMNIFGGKFRNTSLPMVYWKDKRTAYFVGDTLLSTSEGFAGDGYQQLREYILGKNSSNAAFLPMTNIVYFTRDNNIWIRKDKVDIAITSDFDKNIVNGQAVHRNEFGIDKGLFPSPKGNYLAYYRMDQTMVEDYPVVDWSVTPAKNENVKYPMAGRTSHQVTVQIYNIATRQTTAIKTEGPKDQYLTCVTWSPDERSVYIGILNRDQNHLVLNQYNAKTGEKVKTILQEKSDKYVEPQHPLTFLPGSTTEFIWWSQRDGYMHLWLCDIGKSEMTCLTPGKYVVNDLLGFNAARKEVLLTSAKEDPREKHGYAVNWETGKMRRLDTEPGIHNYIASEDGAYLFDVYSSEISDYSYTEFPKPNAPVRGNEPLMVETRVSANESVPKRSVIRAIDGTIKKELLNSPDPLAAYDRPRIYETTLAAKDGTPLYGKLILPTNFDENKQYPVIVYLYNGPHVQLIRNGFPGSGNLWYEYMAQRGYIVWTMDGRGSSIRGLKFEQAIFRQLGKVEMEDHLQGVKFLKSLPYVDTTRMGVHGWSYGGFMTTSLMLRHPGVFKAAVAGGPVLDWRMYEVMYGERYMDTPEQNPEGYKENTLFDKVKNLKGKLLIIHGAQDATVVLQHSVKMLKAAVDEGVQLDFFMYPGHEHNVRGKDRVHLMQQVTDYFDQHLK